MKLAPRKLKDYQECENTSFATLTLARAKLERFLGILTTNQVISLDGGADGSVYLALDQSIHLKFLPFFQASIESNELRKVTHGMR